MSLRTVGIRYIARAGAIAAGSVLYLTVLSTAIAQRAGAQHVTAAADSGVYSAEQAARGDEVFTRVCLQCHTRKDMSSADFRLNWNGRTAFDLYDLIRSTMPDSAPGSLSRDEYADVTAYMLKLNGMRAGAVPLPFDSTLRRIKLDIPATAAPTSSHAGDAPSLSPTLRGFRWLSPVRFPSVLTRRSPVPPRRRWPPWSS